MKAANIAKLVIWKIVAQNASCRGGSCDGSITVGGTLSRSGEGGRGWFAFV